MVNLNESGVRASNYIQIFSSYLTESTLRFDYRDQSVNAVYGRTPCVGGYDVTHMLLNAVWAHRIVVKHCSRW